jgi:hypothetical protein
VTKRNLAEANAQRRRRFDAVHKEGMDALKRGDYEQVGNAIADEHRIIEEQRQSGEGENDEETGQEQHLARAAKTQFEGYDT